LGDFSNYHRCLVYSFKNNVWQEILNFEVRDFDLILEKESKEIPQFILKSENGSLLIRTYNDQAEQIIKEVEI